MPVGEIGLSSKEVSGKGTLMTGAIEFTPEVVIEHFPGHNSGDVSRFLDDEKPMDLVIGGPTYKGCQVIPHFDDHGKITSAEIKYLDRDSGQDA